MVDRLRDTCESHARCNVVEVMGRHAGYIPVECGIAIGATGIAIPEIEFDKEKLINNLINLSHNGKRNFIVMVSEGMGKGFSAELTKEIEEKTGIETRLAVLAHVQRGGSPSCTDRVIATRMGYRAVEQLLAGRYNEVVCYRRGNIHISEMEYAFTFDRIVKGKATEEEIAAIEPALRAEMLERAESKKDYLVRLYNLAEKVSL